MSETPARAPARGGALAGLLREIRRQGLRPRDRLEFALAGLRAGGRDAWLRRRLQVEADYGWLFVLGVNNSGTTILCRILESHPEVRGLPREGQFLTRAFPRAAEHGFGRLWSLCPEVFRWDETADPAPARQAQFDWSRHYPRRSGYLLEKSPPNSIRAPWLQRWFAPATFLAIVRHPYASCEGMVRRSGCDLTDAARHWGAANSMLLADMTRLERALLIRYEDLTDDPATTLTRIGEFLRLRSPLGPEHAEAASAHSIEGRTSGLKNLNARSEERLGQEELRRIEEVAGATMRKVGYLARTTVSDARRSWE